MFIFSQQKADASFCLKVDRFIKVSSTSTAYCVLLFSEKTIDKNGPEFFNNDNKNATVSPLFDFYFRDLQSSIFFLFVNRHLNVNKKSERKAS